MTLQGNGYGITRSTITVVAKGEPRKTMKTCHYIKSLGEI